VLRKALIKFLRLLALAESPRGCLPLFDFIPDLLQLLELNPRTSNVDVQRLQPLFSRPEVLVPEVRRLNHSFHSFRNLHVVLVCR
jgi:hypothetical protein